MYSGHYPMQNSTETTERTTPQLTFPDEHGCRNSQAFELKERKKNTKKNHTL